MFHDTARQPIPQADGADRPFDTHGATGPVLVHVEKSGPAFTRQPAFVPLPIAEQLGASLVSQALISAGDVLRALQRHVLLDLMPAWTRLLQVRGLQLPLALVSPRPRWEWTEIQEAVVLALCSEGPAAWIQADMLIRGYVRDVAEQTQDTLCHVGYLDTAEHQRLQQRLEAYRAFVEARS